MQKLDKKILMSVGVVLLSLIIMATTVSALSVNEATPAGCSSIFSDVTCDHWGYPYIKYLNDNGIVNGYGDGTFGPENIVTRAQFAKMVTLAAGLTYSGSGVEPFDDVPEGGWEYPYVMAAKEHGIINGYSETIFGPNDPVTRAQAAKMTTLAKGLTYTGGGAPFEDVPDDGGWVYLSVMAAKEHGIINGYSETIFGPNDPATRAQASKMVSVMMNIP